MLAPTMFAINPIRYLATLATMWWKPPMRGRIYITVFLTNAIVILLVGLKMHTTLSLFLVYGFFSSIQALNCRSDGGPKEEELKSLYMNCVKHQGKNSSDSRGHMDDYGRNKRRQGGQGGRHDDKMGVGSRDDWSSSGSHDMSRDDRMSKDEWSRGGRYDSTGGSRDDRTGINRNGDQMGRRDDYLEEEFGDMTRYNSYRPSTPAPRRYKRERSTGHRSQYNPNSRKSGYDDSYRHDDERNLKENMTKNMDEKACALHCFLEELEMIGDNGMPDKYLVTQVITKDVKNEDLRDFLHESVDECFQILYNEYNQDKCEFSKNLMMCLSEKGRANCDDWKDDIVRF